MELSITLSSSTRSKAFSGMTGIGTSDFCEHACLNAKKPVKHNPNERNRLQTSHGSRGSRSCLASLCLETAIDEVAAKKHQPEAGLNSNRL